MGMSRFTYWIHNTVGEMQDSWKWHSKKQEDQLEVFKITGNKNNGDGVGRQSAVTVKGQN